VTVKYLVKEEKAAHIPVLAKHLEQLLKKREERP